MRQAYDLALAGAVGAIFGLYLYVELVQAESVYVRDALAGLIIGGSIGFFLSAWVRFATVPGTSWPARCRGACRRRA